MTPTLYMSKRFENTIMGLRIRTFMGVCALHHAWLFSFVIIESKFAVNCQHLIYFIYKKEIFMTGMLPLFSRNVLRRCLTYV